MNPFRPSQCLFVLFLSGSVVLSALSQREAYAQDRRFVGTNHFVRISEKIKPSVANIVRSRAVETQKGKLRLLFDKLFGRKRADEIEDFFTYVLFQEFPQRTLREKMVGSGMVVRKDGLILTNEHVVTEDGTLEVVLSDGRVFPAKVVGRDYLTDLAVIKIDAEDLPPVTFGDSDATRVGEWVLAVGNSLGLQYTVSAGIVSAKGRNLIQESFRPYSNMIQIDAPINLGNSGGPLVDMKGRVIGVNTSVVLEGQSIGFAVPINEAKKILPDLIENGEVSRGWLGVMLQPEINAESLFVINRVVRNSPAEKAGLRPGDKILKIDGETLATRKELQDLIREPKIEMPLSLLVERGDETLEMDVVIEPLPTPKAHPLKRYPPGFEGFILKLPERTRWLLIAGTVLFLFLLLGVKRDMERKSGKTLSRRKDRRAEERRKTRIPFEEVRVIAERRKAERRQSDRREKKSWFQVS